MDKKKSIQNVTIIALAIAIIVMSVGYALYYQPLDINGTAVIKNASWDIHFENVKATDNSNVPAAQITGPTLTNGTSLSFDVDLNIGETYEFTVDVVNDGTFDAALNSVQLTGTKNGGSITTTGNSYSNPYFSYKVTYDDGSQIAANDTLNNGTNKTLLVTVKYEQPTNEADLPSTSETYNFTLDLNYSQV